MVVDAAVVAGHVALAEFLRSQAALFAQSRLARATKSRREELVAERKARVATLEREQERRTRGEKLAHQMSRELEQQVAKGAQLAAAETRKHERASRLARAHGYDV